jgi:hypothetical protein
MQFGHYPQRKKDQLMWIGTSNKISLVKNAYHFENERSLKEKGECSKVSNYNRVWKKIWKMKILGMIKMVL